jgi:hypothetical protein
MDVEKGEGLMEEKCKREEERFFCSQSEYPIEHEGRRDWTTQMRETTKRIDRLRPCSVVPLLPRRLLHSVPVATDARD